MDNITVVRINSSQEPKPKPSNESNRTMLNFTPGRKLWVSKYLALSRGKPKQYGIVNGARWTQNLCRHLQSKDPKIQMQHLNHWKENDAWKGIVGTRPAVVPARQRIGAATSTKPDQGSHTSASHDVANSIQSYDLSRCSTAGTNNQQAQNSAGSIGKKEKIKRHYDLIRYQLLTLQGMVDEFPELQEGIPTTLTVLSDTFARNYQDAVGRAVDSQC